MKARAIIRKVLWVMKTFMLAAVISFFIATYCEAIKLGTIPTPPTSSKLRVFFKAISGPKGNTWFISHNEYEETSYNTVRRSLEEGGIYDLIPQKEVERVLKKQSPTLWQWEKNDWALAKEIGNRLHAEYAIIVIRTFEPYEHVKCVLINIFTKKRFEVLKSTPGIYDPRSWQRTIHISLDKLVQDANEDLLSTAHRKGQNASKELAQTKNEIQELIASQKEENKKQFATVKEKARTDEMPKIPEKSEEKEDNITANTPIKKEPSPELLKTKDSRKDKETEVIIASKRLKPKHLPKPSDNDISRQEKVARLEARLAKLMETFSQLEIMKKQLEEQRKKSALLSKELGERDQREKVLMSKLEDSSKAPPVIVLASPGDNSKTEVDFISLSGVVEDEKGIRRLEIFLNDKPLKMGSERGLKVPHVKSQKRLEFKERVPLERGVNQVRVRVVDSDGLFADKTLTVHYVKKRKNMWAVIIGIDKYPKVRQLKYAVNDARIFYDHMVKYNQIPAENVVLLLDQDATLTKIRSALGTGLKNKAAKDDMVLIYFAGHGATERDTQSPDGDGLEKYLLPVDADLKDLYATALPMGELSRIFNRIRSERLIYIADSCYSGAGGGRSIGVSGIRASLSDAFMDRIAGGKGRVIITASGANEVSAENDELEHGVFTYFLIEGLKGPADTDKDGMVTIDEAYNYVSSRVPQATSQEQNPVKKGTVEGRLVLSVTQ